MDADSDNDAGFEVGRRRTSPSSSRDSSPVAKRPRRSFTPSSDDGHLAVPAAHTESPNLESAPLIRQALGFASVGTSVSTYQATAPPRPAVPYFLPGQAPPPPPSPQAKQKPSKPRAPRKKKGEHFSSQISKFKLTGSVSSLDSGFASGSTASTRNSADASPSRGAAQLAAPMIPVSTYLSGYADDRATRSVTALGDSFHGIKRARKSTKRKTPGVPPRQADVRPSAGSPAPSTQFTFISDPEGIERPSTSHSRTCSATPSPDSTGARGLATTVSQNVQRSLRMITLLIEDTRNGVTDLQLAEVKVPLKIANDPEDGFWADAVDVSEALQSGPSRIDGPAKVYTLRGKFRQFFMRVDQYGQLQVQSAHLGVSKNRTMDAFVEAPGQLPRPSVPPSDGLPGYGSSSAETMARCEPCHRPAYSLVTREDQIERLSKSKYVLPQTGRYASGSRGYRRSQRSASPHRASRHDTYDSPSGALTPPIPGRLADTQEERDEAIVDYIRSHVENHPGWMDYMQSKPKPQRVSEVLKQYAFVEDRVRALVGLRTPAHWDGAPNCYVDRCHVWHVLKLDRQWGEECRETLILVEFYGKKGSRYEDSRVVDMINDTSPPRPDAMERFLRLLRNVDECFTQDALGG